MHAYTFTKGRVKRWLINFGSGSKVGRIMNGFYFLTKSTVFRLSKLIIHEFSFSQ